jgi:hypothetical protein
MTPVMFVGKEDALDIVHALVFHHNTVRCEESYSVLARFVVGMKRHLHSGYFLRPCSVDDQGKKDCHRKMELSKAV